MRARRPRGQRRKGGFILLEAILALALFGAVSVGFTTAIQRVGMTAARVGEQMRVQRMLETLLTEASKAGEFEPGEFDLGTDERDVLYIREIEELEIENMDGQPLQKMYRVAIRASWQHFGKTSERVAELIRYEPLYKNQR